MLAATLQPFIYCPHCSCGKPALPTSPPAHTHSQTLGAKSALVSCFHFAFQSFSFGKGNNPVLSMEEKWFSNFAVVGIYQGATERAQASALFPDFLVSPQILCHVPQAVMSLSTLTEGSFHWQTRFQVCSGLRVLAFILTTAFSDLLSPCNTWGDWSTERLNNSPKATEPIRSRCRIWPQRVWVQNLCT